LRKTIRFGIWTITIYKNSEGKIEIKIQDKDNKDKMIYRFTQDDMSIDINRSVEYVGSPTLSWYHD